MATITLISSREVAERTWEFTFTKPEGFDYQPGQNGDFTLIDPPETDPEGNTRTFSFVTTPSDDHLAIATRMQDTAFKRVLGKMAPGTALTLEGPYGDFTLHEKVSRPGIFLAGGIGITPFHSILKDAAERALPHKLTLFYSNRRPEDAPFLDDLAAFAQKNPNFTFVPTMTEMDKSAASWTGETGYIDSALLERHGVSLDADPLFYMAGPPTMVAAMRKFLNEMAVSNDDIRTEEFSGYVSAPLPQA